MEIKVNIDFDELLNVIKALPEIQLSKLKSELTSHKKVSAKDKNLWKVYFDFLPDHKKTELKEKIMKNLNINQTTFYRRLQMLKDFSLSDKLTIAKLVNLPPHFIFPELEFETY